MARRPSVFVRTLSMDESCRLQRITRTAKDPVRLPRVIVVMMARARAMPSPTLFRCCMSATTMCVM